MSLFKALHEAAYFIGVNIQLIAVDLVDFEEQKNVDNLKKHLEEVDGVLVPGGFGLKAFEYKILSAQYARETKKPFLGICYGFQIAVIEYARNVLKNPEASSEEVLQEISKEQNIKDKSFIIYMPEINRKFYGGNMRLGQRKTLISRNSLAYKIYGSNEVFERHRHRYEVNPEKINILENAGLQFTGRDESGQRMEVVLVFELKPEIHPFYIGVQFHPEFTSKNFEPNLLFVRFLQASCEQSLDDPIKMYEDRFKQNLGISLQ